MLLALNSNPMKLRSICRYPSSILKAMKPALTPRRIIIGLFHFLVFAAPLFFLFRTEELFEFNKIILTYAVTVLISGTLLWQMVRERHLVLRRTFLDIPLGLFLLSQLAATLLSIHPRTSFLGYYTRFHGGLLSWITYTVLYYGFVSVFDRKTIKPLLFTAFGSAFLVALYGILEHFGHSFSCFMVTGGQSFGVDCWIQKVQERVFATFGQPNWLAAYTVMLIPVGAVLSADKKIKLPARSFLGLTTVLMFVTLLFTKSRSGLIAMAVGTLMMAIYYLLIYRINKDNNDISNKEITFSGKWLMGLFGIFLVLALWFGTAVSPSVSELAGSGKDAEHSPTTTETAVVNRLEVGGSDSGEIRKIVWEGALGVWKRYPWTGSGAETFAYSYYQDRPAAHNQVSEWDFLYNKAHNEFLNLLATTGLFGLVAYTLLLLWVAAGIFLLIATPGKEPQDKLFLASLGSGIAALTVSNFFGFSTVVVTILMFLYFAIIAIFGRPADEPAPSESKNNVKLTEAWQYAGLTVVSLVIIFMLARVYNYWAADVAFSRGKAFFSAGRRNEGLAHLAVAATRSPQEALFYDELSSAYAMLALESAQQGQATAAAELASDAITMSNRALALNNVHLNFYKTRARVFIILSQLNKAFLEAARETLQAAIQRAPTDPKLWYNLGVVELSMNLQDEGFASMRQALELKPDYPDARLQLADSLFLAGRLDEARAEYEQALNLWQENERALKGMEAINASNAANTR